MTVQRLILRPRDGLTLKDPRGLELAGGVPAFGLGWPTPTTLAGAACAQLGRAMGLGTGYGQDAPEWARLKADLRVTAAFPVVARMRDQPKFEPLYPAPLDAQPVLTPSGGRRLVRANEWLEPRPRDRSTGGVVAPRPGQQGAVENLWLPRLDARRKPAPRTPWWTAQSFRRWLLSPLFREEQQSAAPVMRIDTRLAIDPETLAAAEGMLFGLPTLEMVTRNDRGETFEVAIALRLQTNSASSEMLTAGWWQLGGKQRLASCEQADDDLFTIPPSVKRRWTESRRLRLVLVTPGQFRSGWHPDWLRAVGGSFEGVLPTLDRRVRLVAAFVDRPQWISGWDVAAGRQKPSWACVPAGAVYYLEALDGQPFAADDAEALWLSSAQTTQGADCTEAAREGYGLVVPGQWPQNPADTHIQAGASS